MDINFFNDIKDPRIERTKKYSLYEILFSALVAIWSGARSWYEISKVAEVSLPLLQQFLPFKNGIPSHDTYNRFFRILPPEELEKVFSSFSSWLIGDDLNGVRINIDGKQMRGATHASNEVIHMVAAWSEEASISLGQLKVDQKSNEITAIPLLLNKLNLRGAEVTIDAMGTQTEIAKIIHEKKGYYFLAVKGNQPTLFKEVQELCTNYKCISVATSLDASKGLVVERVCQVFKANPKVITVSNNWAGLKQVIKITSTTTNKKTKAVTEDIRYYIVNSKFDAVHFLAAARGHWSVENDCHWQLDVTFNEDRTRKTKRSAENFSRLLRFALNCIKAVDFGSNNKSSVKMRCYELAHSRKLLMQLFYAKSKLK